ncbi:MAG TPA: sensor histidine kinase [Alphaproteobacteria bacterium]|nr:sensor histidine kinase [Alphaproteobacteria bacterium]
MTRLPFASLRLRFWSLVGLALLPALGLMLYTASEQRQRAAIEVQQQALRLARLTADDQERLIESTHLFLAMLAHIPEVRHGKPAACAAALANILTHHPLYANLGRATLDGKLECSARPFDGPVNLSDRPYVRGAIERRDFAVGEFQIGRVTRQATINFGYPILDTAGHMQAVVFAAMDLSWLNDRTAEAQLPDGAILLVIDRSGIILARYPNPEVWVGRHGGDDPLFRAMLAQGEGTAELLGPDGIPRLYAFTTLGGAAQAGYVSIGIPTQLAYGPANRTLIRNLAGLGCAGILALAAAWVGGDVFILRRVQALVQATRRLSAGDLGSRTGLPHGAGELGQLAAAFDEMAEALERHEAQRLREEQLRRRNAALEEENRRVEEINRLKSEFVSWVSHELRTPLTAIMGYVELLREGQIGPLEMRQRELLDLVLHQAEQLFGLIDDLLDMSRIEAGKIALQRSELDPAELIQEVAALLRPQIETKGQRLDLDIPAVLPAIYGDAKRLAQVFTNLLGNAHKYTPSGGRISVTARCADGWLQIAVQDTGIGLSAEDQAHLFTPFFRARHPAAQAVGGTGLGLAITRALVELHGGKISVASAPGQGSTFSVALPTTL